MSNQNRLAEDPEGHCREDRTHAPDAYNRNVHCYLFVFGYHHRASHGKFYEVFLFAFSHSACSVMLFLDKLVLFFPVGAVDVRALQATALFNRIASLRLLKDSAIATPVVFEIESPFRRVQLFLLARWRLPTTTNISHTEVSAFP